MEGEGKNGRFLCSSSRIMIMALDTIMGITIMAYQPKYEIFLMH